MGDLSNAKKNKKEEDLFLSTFSGLKKVFGFLFLKIFKS
jgi:hypothetical protein